MSNTQKPKANESDWKKVASCLYRYKGQTYYALLKIRDKQVKQSLETSDREMANRKLRELRGKLEKTDPALARRTLAEHRAHALPDTIHERALAEAASFAVRADVAEEVTRLKTHLDEIARLLQQASHKEGVGKRLDFLIQELHREANTLGSKASAIEMTRISLDMKVLIEQMREQVQNLE